MNTVITRAVKTGIACATACALVATLVAAPALAGKGKLPTGAQVMDQFAQVSGGKAHNNIKSRVSRGTMTVVEAGLEGEVESFWSDGNTYFSWTTATMGKIESGVTDGVAWEVNPMVGAHIKEGAEHKTAMRMATLDHIQNWRDYYREAEFAGVEMLDGRECYKVILRADGEPEFTNYYDRDTGMHVRLESESDTPQGKKSIVFAIRDYREVDGVMIPHKTAVTLNNMQTMLFTTVSVEHNVEIPREQFTLPEAVRATAEARAEVTD